MGICANISYDRFARRHSIRRARGYQDATPVGLNACLMGESITSDMICSGISRKVRRVRTFGLGEPKDNAK